ncbi:hypothetical protein THRCLA_22736 [Thraustotheca clavata]|uniref:Mitochondrial import inner membrane translocase subunit TIM22 n=1 Tax=Thraustotheca clavata TaxID=74557 RepID=A0A1V9YTK6_9STRA|nr:hypothetical protein THRCLA_22736 [Thraustotheca clavata]
MPQATATCDARLAHLVYRGVMTGVLWTISVDGYEHLVQVEKGAATLNLKQLARTAGRNGGAFALFLGTFGGVSCAAENLRGTRDWKNTFLGGFSAGLLLTTKANPTALSSIRATFMTATICGAFASVFGEFSNPE